MDRAIQEGMMDIIWALSPADDMTVMHTLRGSGAVDFLAANSTAVQEQSYPPPAPQPPAPVADPTKASW